MLVQQQGYGETCARWHARTAAEADDGSALPEAQHPAPLAALDESGDAYHAIGSAHCITSAHQADRGVTTLPGIQQLDPHVVTPRSAA